MKRALLITLLLWAFATTSITAESNDPSLGTWILNVAKSKLPGLPPKLFIQRYEMRPDGFIVGTRIAIGPDGDRKSTRLNSSHSQISYAVFCLKTKHTTSRQSIASRRSRRHSRHRDQRSS